MWLGQHVRSRSPVRRGYEMESDRSVTVGDGGKEGYRVTVSTLMMGAGTVSETLVSFNTITRLSARDFTVFSRRESFRTQNKNLLAYRLRVLQHCYQRSGRTNCLSLGLEDVRNLVILKCSLLADKPPSPYCCLF